MRFYTTEQLGAKQALTSEGFLLCSDVPIAREGIQLYAYGEIPVEPDRDGLIKIERLPEEVFRDATIASFNGKPVVNKHPPEGRVTPDIWRKKSIGVVLNPRRGDGLKFDNSFLFADLLIQDKDAIAAVRDGMREVSAGYDAEYQQLAPGHGRQRNIVGNHVALVERGRCGPSCAIGDSAMANRVSLFRDRIRRAVRTRDEAGVLNAVSELAKDPELQGEVISGDDMGELDRSDDKHHITVNVHNPSRDASEEPAVGGGGGMEDRCAAIEERLDTIEQVLAMLAEAEKEETGTGGETGAPDETGDAETEEERKKREEEEERRRREATGDRRRAAVGDSTSMREAFQRTLSQAEILMPGIQLMTFDSAASARTTTDALCNFRRKTLEASYKTEKGRAAIDAVLGSSDAAPKSFFDTAFSCDAANTVFNASAGLIAAQNSGVARSASYGPDGSRNGFSKKVLTPSELNALNQKFYERA